MIICCSHLDDEVRDMLDSLCGVLKADVDSDLLNSSHTNALLLRQLFQQAEKWHLKLQANIAEIEDKWVIYPAIIIVSNFGKL